MKALHYIHIMAINFKKLKKQIHPLKPEAAGKGYIFIATDAQKDNGLFSIAKVGSKRSLMNVLVWTISDDEDWSNEFTF